MNKQVIQLRLIQPFCRGAVKLIQPITTKWLRRMIILLWELLLRVLQLWELQQRELRVQLQERAEEVSYLSERL